MRARGNATLKRSFYAILKSLSAAVPETRAKAVEQAGLPTAFPPLFLRFSPQISSAFPAELLRRRRRRVCVMRLSTTAGVMEICVIFA